MTRSQPQRFLRQSGFLIHPNEWPEGYLMVSLFVFTCCAADAYPVGLPVQLAVSRQAYAPDSWLEIEGKMATATINGRRQLTDSRNQ